MPERPDHALLFDSDCGFCTRSVERIIRWDRGRRLRAVPIESAEGTRLLADVPPERRLDSWHLAGPGGALISGGAAAAPLLRLLPGGRLPAAVLAAFPRATAAAYRWVAAHRDLLGRFLTLALALVVIGCGGGAGSGEPELTVYLSAPLRGIEADAGRAVASGAAAELERAGGEAAGIAVGLEVLDDAAEGGGAAPPGVGWTQAQVAANARAAAEDSTAIAYIGELSSPATRVSAPITNEAGILQLSPGPVAAPLLAAPGGDVPEAFQPSGERTLGALREPGGERLGDDRAYGAEAMALVLDAIGRARDPLDRGSVRDAFLDTGPRKSALGSYEIDPTGLAVFAAPAG
jgi:predicted DCC family thiol-disulfide oxidoreductase YuxK